jgi:hypothetical protein
MLRRNHCGHCGEGARNRQPHSYEHDQPKTCDERLGHGLLDPSCRSSIDTIRDLRRPELDLLGIDGIPTWGESYIASKRVSRCAEKPANIRVPRTATANRYGEQPGGTTDRIVHPRSQP